MLGSTAEIKEIIYILIALGVLLCTEIAEVKVEQITRILITTRSWRLLLLWALSQVVIALVETGKFVFVDFHFLCCGVFILFVQVF